MQSVTIDHPKMLDSLAALPPLAEIPREQLRWLLDHGEIVRVADGTALRGTGDGPRGLFLIMSGRLSHRINQGGVEREVQSLAVGHVTGSLPYSKMTTPRAYLLADGPVELLMIKAEDLREMTRECYEFTAMCVQEMLARARVFKAEDKRHEKMAALGRLSAGLAHELNNPASAAARAVRELDVARAELIIAARDLGAARLTGGALEALQTLESVARGEKEKALSPLEQADLEDRMIEWLEDRNVDTQLAHSLVERGLTTEYLEATSDSLAGEQLSVVLRYLASDYSVRALTADIESATERTWIVRQHSSQSTSRSTWATR
jgi:hypothetical protein